MNSLSKELYLFRRMGDPPRESHNQIIANHFDPNSDYLFVFGQLTSSFKHKLFQEHRIIMHQK